MTRKSDPEAVRKATARMHAQLGFAWQAIREQHPEVPAAVIVVMPRRTKALRGQSCGFSGGSWKHHGSATHEVAIDGEVLMEGPDAVLEALLHQAAHALNFVRGVKDSSRQGRWHNSWYGRSARELGLEGVADDRAGWAQTGLLRGTRTRYEATLDRLARALELWRDTPELTRRQKVEKRTQGWIVGECECGRKVRASTLTWSGAPMICGDCLGPFVCSDRNVMEAEFGLQYDRATNDSGASERMVEAAAAWSGMENADEREAEKIMAHLEELRTRPKVAMEDIPF